MITCKNDRLLELLWFVGYCIEFPTQLAVRIGGGAEWNRRVMYRAIREGYVKLYRRKHKRHVIRSLSLTQKGFDYVAQSDPEAVAMIYSRINCSERVYPSKVDKILRLHAIAVGTVMAHAADAEILISQKPSLMSPAKRTSNTITPDPTQCYYRRIENSKQLGSDGVKISIPTTGNISVITQMTMDSGNYAPTGASYGEFTIMQMSGTPTAKASSFQKEDFVAKYALSNRTLTARELAMVPTLPDWYIIPKEVVRVCEHAKVTTASSQPMRNFLFRGEAGTGKTMGAQAIAAGLNLPYTLMTCSANTEITDLVGQFIPDTNGFHGSTPIEDLPKISDITMHPPSVYMMLTGEYDEEKTEDDVLQKLIEIAVGNLVEKEETPGQRIRYVDTPLVEAIRHGYVCELQEPSCIANPGVLVGLNSLLDNCQVITLPTGERVKRHPDTVIVVTTNSDYSGCRDMNQSVISRMDLIYDMEAPDLNTMVKRVMNVTGFTDEQEATKMAIVVRDVAERCRQTMITDGSCGMREFKSWVLSTMVTHDPYESALSTIISSASADPDNRAELISACLEPQYSRTI